MCEREWQRGRDVPLKKLTLGCCTVCICCYPGSHRGHIQFEETIVNDRKIFFSNLFPTSPAPPSLFLSEGSETVKRETVVSGQTVVSSSVPIARFSEEEKKVSVIKAPHYEGIGPVDESGIPIAIRTVSDIQAFLRELTKITNCILIFFFKKQ